MANTRKLFATATAVKIIVSGLIQFFFLYKDKFRSRELMKYLLIIDCYWSMIISSDERRSDVGIYATNTIKPVTGVLSRMTASVSFQWIWVKDHLWSGATWLLGNLVCFPGIVRLDWRRGTSCTTRRLYSLQHSCYCYVCHYLCLL